MYPGQPDESFGQFALDTCLVTHGALGIAVKILPACTSGDATLVTYKDSSCATPVDSNINYHNCFFDGPGGVPAVMFTCPNEASPAKTTSTVSAGSSSLAVATNVPPSPSDTSPGSASVQDTPASNKASATTALPSSASASSNPSQTNAGSSNGGGSGDPGSGLSHEATIALSVGLPVATLAVAVLAWVWPKPGRKKRHRSGDQYQMFTSSHTLSPPQAHSPSHTFSPSRTPGVSWLMEGVNYGNSGGMVGQVSAPGLW